MEHMGVLVKQAFSEHLVTMALAQVATEEEEEMVDQEVGVQMVQGEWMPQKPAMFC